TSLTGARRLRAMKIVSGSGTDSSAIRGLVDRPVHQGVGESVQLARDVLDRPLREARQELTRAERERSQAGVLDLQSPFICCTTSIESMRTSSTSMPRRRASSSPMISPVYSATLFVAWPRDRMSSA